MTFDKTAVQYFPGCQFCAEPAGILILMGCLNLHCFEYLYCNRCASSIIGGSYVCPICELFIDQEKYWLQNPPGHTPIGRFH